MKIALTELRLIEKFAADPDSTKEQILAYIRSKIMVLGEFESHDKRIQKALEHLKSYMNADTPEADIEPFLKDLLKDLDFDKIAKGVSNKIKSIHNPKKDFLKEEFFDKIKPKCKTCSATDCPIRSSDYEQNNSSDPHEGRPNGAGCS